MPDPPPFPGTAPSFPPAGPFPGTDTLDRPYTAAERRALGKALVAHGFHAAHRAALAFAYKKTHNRAHAEDIVGRVLLRLVRQGWDPAEVPLKVRLCRLVFSEWTHWLEERAAQREAERGFAHDLALIENPHTMSAEERQECEAREAAREAASEARLEKMRVIFREAGDDVNLEWLDYTEQGIDSLDEMARRSKRDVKDFYLATERRKRVTNRLIDEAERATLKGES
jgi:DNA-directed RNA polymerase specialized sigma24 family protein